MLFVKTNLSPVGSFIENTPTNATKDIASEKKKDMIRKKAYSFSVDMPIFWSKSFSKF